MLESDKIRHNRSDYAIVSWWVFRALAKVGFWGRIRDSKLKRLPNVYDHCAVTAAGTPMIFHTHTDKYTGLIADLKNCVNFTFSHFVDSGSQWTSKIWKVAHCFDHWTLTAETKYVIFHKFQKSDLASFLTERTPRNFTFCGFNRLLK